MMTCVSPCIRGTENRNNTEDVWHDSFVVGNYEGLTRADLRS